MPRKKSYIEEEVIEKAMHTFWKNGYEATSVRMLEKEMGINQFSIYASFDDKEGVFLESIKYYKRKLRKELLDDLSISGKGIDSIKKYFYDFLKFIKEDNAYKGCLLTNTINELKPEVQSIIKSQIAEFAKKIRNTFVKILATDTNKDMQMVEKQANYLIVALQGLSIASKMLGKKQLDDFIEETFVHL